MPEAQVVLSLMRPLLPDTPHIRTLSLSTSNPRVDIGRSSQREGKQRTPTSENGWFDSRVVSRDHAVLALKEKTIIVRDYGSTHGTWLNDTRLSVGKDTPLSSGDILRFGVDVDRGDEHFPALSVRCDVAWVLPESGTGTHNPNIEEAKADRTPHSDNTKSELTSISSISSISVSAMTSTNTFCVPDDLDDENDEEDGSEVAGDSMSETSRLDGRDGVPATICTSILQTDDKDEKNVKSHPSYSESTSSISEDALSPSIRFPDSFSAAQYARDCKLGAQQKADAHTDADHFHQLNDNRDGETHRQQENESHPVDDSVWKDSDSSADLDGTESSMSSPSSSVDGNSLIDYSECEDGDSMDDYDSDQSYLNDYDSDQSSLMDYLKRNPLASRNDNEWGCVDPAVLTRDARLAQTPLKEAPHTVPFGGSIAQPATESDLSGHMNTSKIDSYVFPNPNLVLTPVTPKLEFKRDDEDGSQHFGRLSIDDVQTAYQDGPFASPQRPASNQDPADEDPKTVCSCRTSQKRKACEMELEAGEDTEPTVLSIEKQVLASTSPSQVAEAITSALSETAISPPPSKRVKAHHESSAHHAGTYAATAIISALLGGLGTIALLASLPAEYFQ
ncbi:FHA domain-containing protein [Penicillium ucsense]|uniref:FHA domain-containing protein n=1 Tax=Penicillium ucsense TaxID=2839758 RepID=A0A8J8WN97_9EURO|nr:FHA domain-containing protein [Penicillium ucsense]KAF7733823.1 FHA domain-containing protein [Penicillium ucsense]